MTITLSRSREYARVMSELPLAIDDRGELP
jgi:hypothetical protein